MTNRAEKIVALSKNKSVLHLGFIEHETWHDVHRRGGWLHEKIREVAREIVGFDILENEMKDIRSRFDYECFRVDVENITENILKRKFEVIVCGELIEHVSNPGRLLEGSKLYMTEESIVIITTPNPFSMQRMKLIQKNHLETEWLNKEHTMWFTFQTLKQLLDRHNFMEIKYGYYDLFPHRRSIKRLLNEILGRTRPDRQYLKKKFVYNHDGLFFVAKLKPDAGPLASVT